MSSSTEPQSAEQPAINWLSNSSMERCVSLYLPSKRSDSTSIGKDRKKLIKAAMTFLLLELKGATQFEAIGYFVGSDGEVHEEAVTVCRSFCSTNILNEKCADLIRLINSLAIEFEQISIAVEIDNVMHLYEPDAQYREAYQQLLKQGTAGGYHDYINIELPLKGAPIVTPSQAAE